MRNIIFGSVVCLIMIFCSTGYAQGPQHPRDLSFPPLKFDPPNAEKVVLENGITLFLMEDHELPLFSASALFKIGSIYEPEEKIGLAGLAGTVMRTGGTTSMTGDEIDDELEFIAGSVETGIGLETGSASVSVLKKDIRLGLKIFADISFSLIPN